ncbi:HEAT repeat domain-containing protein [Fimbriiglobus ruber]|uniref:HEAT repeat domain-containing protein n=1 Tax=Fimbriiglobus ruber TaxID=1908690 RepID=A0A225E472_9BACT|nr:HEAT repeat domain-containing protein [Fimbriiglobus ruber]OWK45598.1 hypothetical protein FRUB_01929 [Fimbriiglobus ruber]
MESPRANWLWQMVRVVGAVDRFRVPILHALYDLSDDRSAAQLCELAYKYAAAGDETFRTRLFEIVEQKPFPDSPWLGEEEVVSLAGEQGFLFAARVRGRLLAGREWEWDDGHLIDLATKRLGAEFVNRLLDGSSDDAVRRFRDGWRQEVQKTAARESSPTHRERMVVTPVHDIFRAAEGVSKCFWFRGWGMHADEADLRAVLQRLRVENEPRVIANLARVFSARPLPEFDARLIELCRHGDEDVRTRAFAALEPNAHPLVREFALTELEKGVRSGSVVALFINNYRPGDEDRILEAMELPDDECRLHWLLMDVIKVLEKNPEADCSRLGVIGYALTNCENCRFHAVRLLLSRRAAPGWLADECRYDSGEDCRELVGFPMVATEASSASP